MNISDFGGIVSVAVGWVLATMTRHFDAVWFGAKLKIVCKDAVGNRDETRHAVFIKFRVENRTKRHVAKNCRAYLVAKASEVLVFDLRVYGQPESQGRLHIRGQI